MPFYLMCRRGRGAVVLAQADTSAAAEQVREMGYHRQGAARILIVEAPDGQQAKVRARQQLGLRDPDGPRGERPLAGD